MYILGVSVLDSKIVNDQGEDEVGFVVAPQPGGDRNGSVAFGGEERGELVVGNASGLRESVHAAADFGVDVTFVYQRQ